MVEIEHYIPYITARSAFVKCTNYHCAAWAYTTTNAPNYIVAHLRRAKCLRYFRFYQRESPPEPIGFSSYCAWRLRVTDPSKSPLSGETFVLITTSGNILINSFSTLSVSRGCCGAPTARKMFALFSILPKCASSGGGDILV